MKKVLFTGSGVAIVTPFDENDDVMDHLAIARQALGHRRFVVADHMGEEAGRLGDAAERVADVPEVVREARLPVGHERALIRGERRDRRARGGELEALCGLIPFKNFVEMYTGDARFERIEENQYRIISFDPEMVRDLSGGK